MKKLSKKILKVAEEAVAYTTVASLVMILVETLLFVVGIAKYTDIMAWIIIAGVAYIIFNLSWEE